MHVSKILYYGERQYSVCKYINILLTYQEVSIYLKYGISKLLSKLVNVWWKVDFSRNCCDEGSYFCEMKEGCKVFRVKIITLLIIVKEDSNTQFFIFSNRVLYTVLNQVLNSISFNTLSINSTHQLYSSIKDQ